MIPFLAIFAFLDGIQGVCSGILRGTGQQKLGAIANLAAFYIIGLPMAWLICFVFKWGVNGLIIGLSFGTLFQATLLTFYIFFRQNQIFKEKLIKADEVIENPISFIKSDNSELSTSTEESKDEYGIEKLNNI